MKSSTQLDIKGMNCASCVNRIEKALKKNQGIISASVNLVTEKANVEFETSQINTKKIMELISEVGYEASPTFQEKKESKDRGLKKDKYNIIFSFLLTLPLVLPMFIEPFGYHFMPSPWFQLLLATPIQFFIGARFYKSAWNALKAKSGNMELLVAIGTSAAYGLSLYLLLKDPGHDTPHLYFESSAMIISLVLLGKYLESKAKQQTSTAIKALQSLRPEKARVLKNNLEEEVSVETLKLNDVVLVRPGERIPVDGILIKGATQVDESLITGESLPVEKNEQDKIIGGSVNGNGFVQIKVTAIGAETMLSRIIRMVENAQAVKAPIQRLVDRVSAYFVPFVLIISFITIMITGIITHDWETAIIRGVAVLVIACPCALGLATPTSIMVGTGVAAKAGILIKDAEALEVTHSITAIAFDKTGTLTEGRPSLSKLFAFQGRSDQEILTILATIQNGSGHPLAKAIIEEATKREISLRHASFINELPGRGVEAEIEGHKYFIGSKRFVESMNLLNEAATTLKDKNISGETVSFLVDVTKMELIGLVTFKDAIKDSSRKTIQKLKELEIKTIILTGDNQDSADAVAKELGIDFVKAEVLPQDKSEIISELKRKGEIVGMVGDGINDAPALTSAHVGMAMSTGTDVAMHSAGITLMRGNPLLIPDAISVSRKTYSKIKQNLFWAFIYNVIGIPLAAMGYLSPVVAGAAMAMSSVSVVTNSLLLKRWKPSKNL